MFYEGAVLRNVRGERFMLRHSDRGEQVGKDLLAKAIAAEIRSGNGTEHGGVWFDATAVPAPLWEGVYQPYLNRYLAHGIDLRQQAVEIAPAAHTTCGGVLIDEACRTGVPGLLACGEVAGGLHGANRLGGNAGLEVMVFGRIAGQTALCEVRGAAPVSVEENPTHNKSADVSALRTQLAELLRADLGVIRTEAELKDGIAKVTAMLQQVEDYTNCFEKHRLYNDLLTARLALTGALYRTGSIGCHIRADDLPEEPYRSILRQTMGKPALKKVPV
jgi:aspartate oxidase